MKNSGEWTWARAGPRFKEFPLRGSGGRCYVLWMLETLRVRQGLEKEADCKGCQRSQECHPGMPQAVQAKGQFTELQGLSPREGSWPKACGRISVPSQKDS